MLQAQILQTQSCHLEGHCNRLCYGAVCAQLGSWQWGCREGLGQVHMP